MCQSGHFGGHFGKFRIDFSHVTNHIFHFYVTHDVQYIQIQHFTTFEEKRQNLNLWARDLTRGWTSTQMTVDE